MNDKPCPICEGDSSRFLNIGSFQIRRCSRCGHAFVHPIPSEKITKAFNDSDRDEIWNSGGIPLVQCYLENRAIFWKYYELIRIRRLLKVLPALTPQAKLLDVGSSASLFLATLRDKHGFKDIYGLEVSTIVREYVATHLKLRIYDSPETLPKGFFDIITLFDVIEHIPNPITYIRELKTLLKKNGRIIVQTPNHESILRYLCRGNWLWYIPPAHVHYFSPNSLKVLLERSGFKIWLFSTLTPASYSYFLLYYLRRLLKKPAPRTTDYPYPAILALLNIERAAKAVFFLIIKIFEKMKLETQCFIVAETPD